MTKGVFEVGFAHYDDAPPDDIGPDIPATLEALRAADRLRFANHLAAFAEFADDGSVVDAGYLGGGQIGSTTVRLGKRFTVAAVSLPDRQHEPEIGDGWVRFTPVGGRADWVPHAAGGPPPAVRAVLRPDRLVDAGADAPRRRAQRDAGWSGRRRSRAIGSTTTAGR